MPDISRLLIVYHTRTGGTRQMVAAAQAGIAREAAVALQTREAATASPEDLLSADGYVFACPENLAAMSGAMKEFFDRSYYPVLGRIEGRPYALLICAGSDGSNAARQIERIATGWRLRRIAPTLIVCTHAQSPERIAAAKTIGSADLERCRELGQTIAAGLAMGIY